MEKNDVEFVEEEADVVLPNTELGKYLQEQNVFGHFHDNLISNTPNCGSVSHPKLCYSKLNITDAFKHILHGTIIFKIYEALVEKLYHLVELIYPDYLMFKISLITFWESFVALARSTFQKKTRHEIISEKYSIETRLKKHSEDMEKSCKELLNVINSFNNETNQLLNIKRMSNREKLESEIYQKIFLQSEVIKNWLENIEKLRTVQTQCFRSMQMNQINKIPKRIHQELEPEECTSEILDEPDLLKTDGTETVFENQPSCNNISYETEACDEFFESTTEQLIESNQFRECIEKDLPNEEVMFYQRELLSQLQDCLVSTRAKMKEREDKAYFQQYGKFPDSEESAQLTVLTETLDVSNHNDIISKSDDDEFCEEIYGDELEEEDISDIRKSEFLNSLKMLLDKRGP